MKSKFISVIVFLLLFIFPSCNGGQIDIVSGGSSNFQIIISNEANKNEIKSAKVLQNYIALSTGVELRINVESKVDPHKSSIFVGLSTINLITKDIRDDGFLIKSSNKDLFIFGNSGRGTLYGVYTFIEQYLHAKKLAGNLPAIVPKTLTIQIPSQLHLIQNSPFIFRQSYYPSSLDSEYMDWHKLQSFEDFWGLWGHSFFKIIDPKVYFSENPEYFAMVNEKRQATQLCLSNKEVLKKTISYFTTAIQKNPDASYWSIAPMDNSGYCTCDECAQIDSEEGGPQGTLIRFVNAVARKFPNQKFTTLAYAYTAKPPTKTKPEKNVYIMLSTIDAKRTLPLALEPSAKSFREYLSAWSRITKNIFIWDYTTQFTNYLSPFPDYNNLQSNVNYYLKHGVKGIFFQGSEDHPSDMDELNSYLQAKLLWNPDEQEDQLKAAFLKDYYGAASKFIEEYLNLLTIELQKTKSQLDIYGNPILDRKGYLSPENINQYSALLTKGEAAVSESTPFYKRVEKVELGLEYVVLQQSQAFGIEKFGYLIYDPNSEQYIISPKWPGRIQRFIRTCNQFGVTQLGETGPNLQTYQNTWNAILEKGWTENAAFHAQLSLKYPFSEEYPANGIQTLVDGLNGTSDFSYNWLLFYNQDLEFTVDFSKEKEIHNIKADFLFDPKHYIFLPNSLTVLASDDGKDYKKIKTIPITPYNQELDVQSFNLTIELHYFARFYKVVATCPNALPEWRYNPLKKPSIASDELYFQ